MAVMTYYLKSEYVGFETSFLVILPQKKHVRCAASPEMRKGSFHRGCRTLLLLHDEACGPADWLYMTSLARYAAEQDLAVIMPDCARSFYSDYAVRDKSGAGANDTDIKVLQKFDELMYESYLMNELLPYVKAVLPLSDRREDWFIGGAGMGGFGALKLGLNYSDHFGALFSLSGLADLSWGMKSFPEKRQQFEAIFGGLTVNAGSAEDFPAAYARAVRDGTVPRILLTANQGHPYEESSRLLAKALTEQGARINIETDEREMDWEYLDRKIRDILGWLKG